MFYCDRHYPVPKRHHSVPLVGRCFACQLEEWLAFKGAPSIPYLIRRDGTVKVLNAPRVETDSP